MYAGGELGPLVELLAPEIVWLVPGTSPIAGEYRGVEAVLDYFERRRELAATSMRMRPRGHFAGGDIVAQLVDGSATLGAELVEWRTVGIYRVSAGLVHQTSLVPLDLELFDRIWTPPQG